MFEIIELVVFFIIALIVIIKAADIFVDNVLKVGSSLGVSQVLLGITAVAIGTSLPEYGSALISSLNPSAGSMGVGIVVGTNIWNLAGILGIAAVISGSIKADKKFLTRDGLMAVLVSVLLFIVMIAIFITGSSTISKIGAILMMMVFAFYMWILIKDQKNEAKIKEKISEHKEAVTKINENIPEIIEDVKKPLNKKNILFVFIGLISIILGCELLVHSATGLCEILRIDPVIMGLFIIGITTSLPELVITVTSAVRGLHGMAVGNIIGTAAFNILIGVGIPSFIVVMPVDAISLYFDAPYMIAVYVLVLFLVKYNDMKLTRLTGLVLVALYILYAILRIFIIPPFFV